ncbi:hypothetical protein [Paenarthrobacter nitroguajacolicus]|nr:hypothetical protein [Paenarthrobacter nitroguajacolicus]
MKDQRDRALTSGFLSLGEPFLEFRFRVLASLAQPKQLLNQRILWD